MKNLILFLSLLVAANLFSQTKLRAYLDNKQFYAPEIGNYIEFHMQFIGHTFDFKGVENGLQADLAISLEVKKGSDFVYSDAYRLESPVMLDSIVEDFYDIQRISLKPGDYSFKLVIDDLLNDEPPLATSHMFKIEELGDGVSLSDIEIAEFAVKGKPESVFYRSGLEIIPRLSTFYPEQLDQIPFYLEIYNSGLLPDSVFGVKHEVIQAETGDTLHHLTSYSRHKVSDVVPIFKSLDLNQVYTGKYILKVSLITRELHELASQSYEFERSFEGDQDLTLMAVTIDPAFQSSISDDSLGYYMESIIPICGPQLTRQLLDIIKKKEAKSSREFFQKFWTATSPQNPYDAWLKYKMQVQYVERMYGNNFQEGFETDRGRVYLQYGAPTTVVAKENSPSEYPYEMWQYNKIGRFSNKRFIFYNPDLVNNAHRLLHSDMIGEIKNPSWPRELAKRNTVNGTVDNPNEGVIDHWGGNSNDLFRQY